MIQIDKKNGGGFYYTPPTQLAQVRFWLHWLQLGWHWTQSNWVVFPRNPGGQVDKHYPRCRKAPVLQERQVVAVVPLQDLQVV